MKRFATLLEKELTPAQEKAQKLGLKYRGFGYWQDPKTGKTTYKTQGDELIPIDQEKAAELDGEEEEIAMGEPLSQEDSESSSVPMAAGTNILGAPAPGKERPTSIENEEDPTETGWDAGPDGDNMVNDQNKPKDEIPKDTYVGSNNNLSWVAGPDGSNFKNLSFDNIIDEAKRYFTEVNRSARTQGAKELNSGLNTHGAELLARNRRERGSKDAAVTQWHKDGGVGTTDARMHAKRNRDVQQSDSDRKHRREIEAPTQKRMGDLHKAFGGDSDYDDPHDQIMDSLSKLLNPPSKSYTGAETKLANLKGGKGDQTEFEAAAALKKLSPSEQKAEMEKLAAAAERTAPGWARDPDKYRANDVRGLMKDLRARPQENKDKERVAKMNEELRALLADPSVALELDGLTGKGSGAFGETYITPDMANVIKHGKIGHKELAALHKLKESPYFPTLMNAMFESPFTHQSSARNNPGADPNLARGTGVDNYSFNADSDGWPIPTARGTYAMSLAKGKPYSRIRDNYYGEDSESRVANIWRAREALHRAGISHNDMHGENVFMDDDGNPTILDLGLANDDAMSALQEALGGYSDQDYQLASGAKYENLPQALQDKIRQNIEGVQEKMKERLGIISDKNNPDYDWGTENDFEKFFSGGIRIKDDKLQKMREKYDLSDDEILDFISQIYDGLTPKEESELEKRMSAAYDNRKRDSGILGTANHVRKNKGKPPLDFKHVIPPKNLDMSDFDWDD